MIHEVYIAGKTYIFAERNGHFKFIESQTRGASEYRQTMYHLKDLFTRSLNEPEESKDVAYALNFFYIDE